MVGEVRAEGARFANPFRERFRCTEPRFSVFRIDLSMLWCGAGGGWGFHSRLGGFTRQNRETDFGQNWTYLVREIE